MHNCPLAGKWSIAVWEGASGTAASDTMAACSTDAVDVAYALDPQTGVWSRWFAGRPNVSNLPPLNDMQGVLALGSAQVQETPVPGLPNPATVYCVELGYEWSIVENPEGQAGMCVFPDGTQCDEWSFFEGECGQSWAPDTNGTMHNCPPAGKWSIAVWDGASGTEAADALVSCGADAVTAAYSLDSQTGAWSRWFAGKPDVSNLAPLSDMQGVLALGAAATPTPTPMATATQTPVPTATPTSTVLGLPIVPGRTYVGSTSEGYLVALWLSADGQKLEPYGEAGEPVTVSFLIQVSRPEACPMNGTGVWPGYWEELPPAQDTLWEALDALDDPATFTWFTGEEIAISNGLFQRPPHGTHEVSISGNIQNGLASGQFSGSVEYDPLYGPTETCTFAPVTWSASAQ